MTRKTAEFIHNATSIHLCFNWASAWLCFTVALMLYVPQQMTTVYASERHQTSDGMSEQNRWMDARERKETDIDQHLATNDVRRELENKELKDSQDTMAAKLSHDEGIAIGGFIAMGILQTAGGIVQTLSFLFKARAQTTT
jgi:hypothetical protein